MQSACPQHLDGKTHCMIHSISLVSLWIGSFFVAHPNNDTTPLPKPPAKAHMQLVFALDATGSMSGLIAAAKEKIWAIASSMSQTDPSPDIEIGLIFYRDRGDQFVTSLVPLSSNLDDIYEKLMQMQANGGGDEPESVNQALYEAVTQFKWNKNDSTYKTIFLVGDCPPHMNYPNDIKYQQTCQLAKEKDIVLNTILMGNNSTAKRIWGEIAACSQGSFVQLNMNVNDIVIETPFDAGIAKISDLLDANRYYYGNKEEKVLAEGKMKKSDYVALNAKSTAKVQRAEYNNISGSGSKVYYGTKELLNDIKDKKVVLEKLKDEELPDVLKQLPVAKRAAFVAQQVQLRDSLQKELKILVDKRKAYIDADLAKRKPDDVSKSFNSVIFENMKQQTKKKNIELKGKAKY